MSSSNYEFRSDLSKTPIGKVLETVHRFRVPGVITVRKEEIQKKVFIWHGDVIFSTSSDHQDSLGQVLLRSGRLTQNQFEQASRLLAGSGGTKRLGVILVELGVVDPPSLEALILEQVKGIITGLFDWDGGEVTFAVGEYRTDELVQLRIPTRKMVVEGVKAVKDARRLVGELGPSWTVFSPSYEQGRIGDVGLAPQEAAFLALVDGKRTLRDLVAAGPGDAPHNARLLYAFFILKLVSRRDTDSRGIKKLQWKSPRETSFSGD